MNGTTTIGLNEEIKEPRLYEILRSCVIEDLETWERNNHVPLLQYERAPGDVTPESRKLNDDYWKARTRYLNERRAVHYYAILNSDDIPQELKDELVNSELTKYYMRDALP